MSNDWAADIEKIVKRTQDNLGRFSRAVKISLFNDVIDNTRWKTGRLRGNWNISEGSPDRSVSESLDPTGSGAKARIADESSENGVTYLTNNLPYAQVYEEKDAMVGTAVARIGRIIKDEASKL